MFLISSLGVSNVTVYCIADPYVEVGADLRGLKIDIVFAGGNRNCFAQKRYERYLCDRLNGGNSI